MRRAFVCASALCVAMLLTGPAQALAHGLVGRQDLPIPKWLFGWAAAIILLVSFVALAVLWPKPRLEADSLKPLRAPLDRALAARWLRVAAGAVGLLLLGLVVYAGLFGSDTATANIAPTFVYVVFWLGLVPISILFGDVFRALNPWAAAARAVSSVTTRVRGGAMPPALPYPERLGRWPAAATIFAFAWMELISGSGDDPQNVAIAALIYSALTWIAMATYGIDAWLDRGEGFSVYFNLYSRLSVLERRGDRIGRRRFMAGLTQLERLPGTVALLAVMIGSTSFDGLSGGSLFQDLLPDLQDFWDIFLGLEASGEAAYATGLVAMIAIVYGFYWLGVAGARTVGGGFTHGRLANAFVHSLVPIAIAYVAAHYVSLLIFQGQIVPALLSDPLGEGSDIFGWAGATIDYGVVSAEAFWYIQTAFVILGHLAALMLAHDRALALYPNVKLAVRSQYWMLGVMVGFTSLALWLLSEAAGG